MNGGEHHQQLGEGNTFRASHTAERCSPRGASGKSSAVGLHSVPRHLLLTLRAGVLLGFPIRDLPRCPVAVHLPLLIRTPNPQL